MTEDAAPDPARRYNSMLPGAIMLPALEMWQDSLKLGTAWWNGMIGVWWPPHPFHRALAHHDPHHQLIVPEPIEAEGERALLA